MYRSLMMCLTIYLCGAAVVPIKDQTNDEQSEKNDETNQRTFATLGIGGQQQIYPVNRYHYPTYPEYGNNGYAIQTGYEGYLVPAVVPQQNTDSAWITEIGTSLLPFSDEILLYGIRAGAYLLHFLFAIILGGAFTTVVCTFTPICTISFIGFGFTNNHQVKEQVAELSQGLLNDEVVNVATILISRALDNYAAMQRERQENRKEKEGEKLNDSSSMR
uniref:uncharacterized protein LOC117600996 n=1 Tax=Osmia lignaria TaxID=473952 RepID=UPI0014787605|nr:uncharacterized protein LOC117600996 [Osmia lignaria]